jgi:hypothetical protein
MFVIPYNMEPEMDRRRFIGAGTASVLGMAAGAATSPGAASASPLPPPPPDLDAYLRRVDAGMQELETWSISDRFEGWSGDRAEADVLTRRIMQSLYFTGMMAELPLDMQIRPEVQDRIDAATPIMDEATERTLAFLRSRTPADLEQAQTALQDGNVGARIVDRFDAMAVAAGVSERRRAHTRAILAQTEWRLRTQPPATVLGEYADKVERLTASDLMTEARTRELAARMGEDAFWQQAGSARERRLSSGAKTMGWGLAIFAGGALIVAAGVFEGVFVMTVGAIVLLVGLIMVIAGAMTRGVD